MLNIKQRINAFARMGQWLMQEDAALAAEIVKAGQQNAWFAKQQVQYALKQWSELLNEVSLSNWLERYTLDKEKPRTIGVVNAGNIPLVGFHDFMTVLLSGNRYQGKNASDDSILLPFLAGKLQELEPAFVPHISFADRLLDFDAVIATGSNNSARYFSYYFSRYPHIIRRNRNGVALLDGKESETQLAALGEDVFRYFGLGCRNVSHLLVPEGYDFSKLFEAFESQAAVANHHKYCNNYEYYRAVLALKKVPYLDNGFLIVKKDEALSTPISILNYSFYSTREEALKRLADKKDHIQCVVSSVHLPFGSTQQPALSDYADGVDTVEFLAQTMRSSGNMIPQRHS